MAVLAGQHDGHGIGDFRSDQAPVPDGSFYPGERMQERSGNCGIDRRESHPKRANHPAQDIARPRNSERRRSLGAHAKLVCSSDDATRAFQDHDLPRLLRERCGRRVAIGLNVGGRLTQ